MAGGQSVPAGKVVAPRFDLRLSSTAAAIIVTNGKQTKEAEVPESSAGDGVATMMGRLRLTAKESKTFVLDKELDEAAGCPEWAIVGKVLAPNTLHIQTIKAVLRPAWGNPKGLDARSMGPNMFIAEFGSKADMQRVLNGSPWVLGKNVILLKEFDPLVKAEDVVFDRLLLWVRIHSLPYSLMNSDRGTALAEMIGDVDHLEVDEHGRAWGRYLRARIHVDVTEPLMRCVAVESSSLNKMVYYEVKYEKLPLFCFSYGLIGHTSLICPTPEERDEEGKLPWNGDRVCVPDERKKEARSSSGQGSNSGQGSSSQPTAGDRKNAEVSSPSKPRKPREKKQQAATAQNGAQINVVGEANRTTGQKRKQVKLYRQKAPSTVLAIDQPLAFANVATPPIAVEDGTGPRGDASSEDSNKKQKNSDTVSTSRSADPAVAAGQPHLTQ
ncbi:hypothetical protein ACQ4PT_017330 [Festuca glaucescens]